MLWVKALHVIFMVTWFAGLFYLPRLFVYHALATDTPSRERFKVMERKLYWGIMTPGAVLTIAFGLWLLFDYGWAAYKHTGWLPLKLVLVGFLVGQHLYCWKLMRDFARDQNKKSHVWYRVFNELIPATCLFGIVILVIVKPW